MSCPYNSEVLGLKKEEDNTNDNNDPMSWMIPVTNT